MGTKSPKGIHNGHNERLENGILLWLRLNANIMSLGGIAIAIGDMVDGAIVMVENAHKHLAGLILYYTSTYVEQVGVSQHDNTCSFIIIIIILLSFF